MNLFSVARVNVMHIGYTNLSRSRCRKMVFSLWRLTWDRPISMPVYVSLYTGVLHIIYTTYLMWWSRMST